MIDSKAGTAIIGIRIPPGYPIVGGVNAEKIEVSGHIIGDFIIYHTFVWEDHERIQLKNWAINHIPTGLMIKSRISNLAKAKECAAKLNALFPKHGWTFGMSFFQNMFVTEEQKVAAREYVNSIPTEPYL